MDMTAYQWLDSCEEIDTAIEGSEDEDQGEDSGIRA